MATLNLLQMRTEARMYMVDPDTTNPALDDSQMNTIINDSMQDYFSAFPEVLVASIGTLAVSAGVFTGAVTGSVNFRNIKQAQDSSGRFLERAEWPDMQYMLNIEGLTANGLTRWSALKSATNYKSWTVAVYPLFTGLTTATVTFYGEKEPVALSSDSDTPVCGEPESRWISRLAAIRGANLIGRPQEHIQGMVNDLPQWLANGMKLTQGVQRPRPQTEKSGI